MDTRDVIIDLVEDYDVAKGKIIYKSPSEGIVIDIFEFLAMHIYRNIPSSLDGSRSIQPGSCSSFHVCGY